MNMNEQTLDRIRTSFTESIQTKILSADTLLEVIAKAASCVVHHLLEGHRIFTCGNGGSACDAMHFSSEMINRFRHERPGLPVIALTADTPVLTSIANDYSYDDVFARQVRALGQPNDILLAITTSGQSPNILHAVHAAHDRRMRVVALTGHTGGKLADLLASEDIEIRIPAADTARIQETHLLVIHCLCDIVEYSLFGDQDAVRHSPEYHSTGEITA